MVFQFEHVGLDHGRQQMGPQPLDLRDLKRSLGRWQEGLAEIGWNSLYWNNHDQPRVVSRFGDDGEYRVRSAKMLGTVLHLHRGTPYVYQGEELGMTNVAFGAIGDFRDIESVNHFPRPSRTGPDPERCSRDAAESRDNARTPMQWDDSPHAGFTTGRAVDRGQPQPRGGQRRRGASPTRDSVFHHYRRLIELRHAEPAVVHGDFTMLLAGPPAASTPSPGRTRAPSCSSWPTSPPSPRARPPSRTPRHGRRRSSCSRTPSPSRGGSSSGRGRRGSTPASGSLP